MRLKNLSLLSIVIFYCQSCIILGRGAPPPISNGYTPESNANRQKWPHFGRPQYDRHVEPLASYRLTSAGTIAESASSSGIELGARPSFDHMSLNQGSHSLLAISLLGGAAGGEITTTLTETKGKGTSESKLRYARGFAEISGEYYYKSFRILAGVSRGTLSYRVDDVPAVQDVIGKGSTGLRVLKWLSIHDDTIYRHVYSKVFSDPTTVELLNWPHILLDLSQWHLEIDLGPGLGYVQESQLSQVSAEGTVRFGLIKFKIIKFYGFDIEGRSRYIVKNSDPGLGYYATTKLPQEDMSSPPLLTAPSDTMTLSLFLNQYVHSFKLGYWGNWLVFDYAHKYQKKSHTNQESGFGIFLGYPL